MIFKSRPLTISLTAAFSILLLTACDSNSNSEDHFEGLTVNLLVGSALGDFCNQAATNFNATKPQLENGTAFQVKCSSVGSGDVVTKLITLATQLKKGTLPADAPGEFKRSICAIAI